jgi:hypothetical protein
MAKTPTLQKIERVIEKTINIANRYEIQYGSPMGDDYLDIITIMYDPKTSLSEINDEYIENHNKIHGSLDRIPYGTKYYGTVYVRIIKIETYDMDGLSETNINPVRRDIPSGGELELFVQITDRLYGLLPKGLFDLDIDFTFKNGV